MQNQPNTCDWEKFGNLEYKDINGNTIKMNQFYGNTLMIVNVASNCGFTKQYESLEKIYQKHKNNKFEIIAFPCNQFGQQEPGTEEEIYDFCKTKYNVSFNLASKVEVNGPNTHPIYKYLKENMSFISQRPGFKIQPKAALDIDWNFEKFIIYKDGTIFHYAPDVDPDMLAYEIEID